MSNVRGASLYWCMCDEEGDECETRHTHIFIYRSSAFTYLQIDALFPKMYRDNCYGSCPENRAYILKDGPKFNKAPDGTYHYKDKKGKLHVGTNFSDTFYESGECPVDGGSSSSTSEAIVDMIRDARPTEEILNLYPTAYKNIEDIERTRSLYRDSDFMNKWRDLTVTYIFGRTGSGKTRSVIPTILALFQRAIKSGGLLLIPLLLLLLSLGRLLLMALASSYLRLVPMAVIMTRIYQILRLTTTVWKRIILILFLCFLLTGLFVLCRLILPIIMRISTLTIMFRLSLILSGVVFGY